MWNKSDDLVMTKDNPHSGRPAVRTFVVYNAGCSDQNESNEGGAGPTAMFVIARITQLQ